MSETPTIILDPETRRPLIQFLVDTAFYAFQQGLESRDEDPPDVRVEELEAELARVIEENKRLKRELEQTSQEMAEAALIRVKSEREQMTSLELAKACLYHASTSAHYQAPGQARQAISSLFGPEVDAQIQADLLEPM